MEDSPSSFVDVHHVDVAYDEPVGLLKRMSGQRPTTHSVLRDVSLKLSQGSWATLFGPAGSGKTTLLRLLTGAFKPNRGRIVINGKRPWETGASIAAGYVSGEESEPAQETAGEILHAFGRTHNVQNFPARLGIISETLALGSLLHRQADRLSTTERLRVNMARAALSDTPLILLDDCAEQIGAAEMKRLISSLFYSRTVIVATRFPDTAEALDLPILLLHNGSLIHYGTCEELAKSVACQRIVDIWVEGLRYDLFRSLRKHPGVAEVRLLSDGRFAGQRVRVTLHSSRYLPAIYDLVSQAPLVRIEELPVSLTEILRQL